jgi:hypothetical protein
MGLWPVLAKHPGEQRPIDTAATYDTHAEAPLLDRRRQCGGDGCSTRPLRDQPPARITVGGVDLALGGAVEIDCVAYRGR